MLNIISFDAKEMDEEKEGNKKEILKKEKKIQERVVR